MKINDEILKEVATILRNQELNDPRLEAMITVTHVDTTKDLNESKIHVSVFSDNKEDTMEGLGNSAGYLRKLIAKRINLRKTPELIFVLDESLDKSIRISELLKEAGKGSKNE